MARVLVIEDELNISFVLKTVLKDEGHEVVTALNGAAGLDLLEQDPLPNVVLADLCMPGLGGQALVEIMRSNPRLKNIPVAIITGSFPSAKNFPPRESYQALISKPFDLSEVIDTVEKLSKTEIQPISSKTLISEAV